MDPRYVWLESNHPSRGRNNRGQNWGCRMMSGRLQHDWGEYNSYKSQQIAQDVILKQQRMRKFPCKGAAVVPIEAHWFQRLPLKQPYNPKDHLPSQTVSAAHGHKEANVLLFTMGCDTKGIAYNPDPKVRFAEIQNKLRRHGHNIPSAQIFDCVPLGNGNIGSWHYTTGRDWKLFGAVWEHPKVVDIFNSFLFGEHEVQQYPCSWR